MKSTKLMQLKYIEYTTTSLIFILSNIGIFFNKAYQEKFFPKGKYILMNRFYLNLLTVFDNQLKAV